VTTFTTCRLGLCLLLTPLAEAQKFYTYIGDTGPTHALIAWGTADGVNTIGRSSPSHGKATVRVGEQTIESEQNWTIVRNLEPAKEYEYEVRIGKTKVGGSKFRTWPAQSDKLVFFVIGDMGNGSSEQYRIADVMAKEFDKRYGSDNPVRFVLTVGDNIYGALTLFGYRRTGDSDREWGPKFFQPYEKILARAPFYSTLGNHDGNETEGRGDLAAELDNLFFPGGDPARYYRFSYGGLADFFGLDTTQNTERGPPAPGYLDDSRQHAWLVQNLASSEVPWKIAYFHHPPFSAGPRHAGSYRELEHFIQAFIKYGARVVFSGHEHNLQIAEDSERTHNIQFVVTGAGGELRSGDIRANMERNAILGWAPQHHFLIVEIDKREMTITPMGFERIRVFGRRNTELEMPLKLRLPDSPPSSKPRAAAGHAERWSGLRLAAEAQRTMKLHPQNRRVHWLESASAF
jgi:hypothetical protein